MPLTILSPDRRRSRKRGLLALHPQIIGHGKDTADCAGAEVGEILVGLRCHHAFQRYLAGIDDDVNGRHGLHGVAHQTGLAVDGAVFGHADSNFCSRSRWLQNNIPSKYSRRRVPMSRSMNGWETGTYGRD